MFLRAHAGGGPPTRVKVDSARRPSVKLEVGDHTRSRSLPETAAEAAERSAQTAAHAHAQTLTMRLCVSVKKNTSASVRRMFVSAAHLRGESGKLVCQPQNQPSSVKAVGKNSSNERTILIIFTEQTDLILQDHHFYGGQTRFSQNN